MTDAVGPFFQSLTDAFPGASPDIFARARRVDPGAFDGREEWLLTFRCFVIRSEYATVIVDAGVGPARPGAPEWLPTPGRLPELLDAADIDAGAADAVVLTHLHSDHIGWSVVESHTLFPNARYVVQSADIDAMRWRPDTHVGGIVRDLETSGQLQVVDGRITLARELVVVPTPGHTPGHQSVVVAGPDRDVVLAGDVVVHAAQLVDPAVVYAHEEDADLAQATRRALLTPGARPVVLATAHLGSAFVTIQANGLRGESK